MEIFQTIWTALTTPNETLIYIFHVIGIPFTFIEAYVTAIFALTILNIKYTTKKLAKYIMFFYLYSLILNTVVPINIKGFLNILMVPLLFHFIFKSNLIKSILAEILPILVIAICESFSVKLFTSSFDITVESLKVIPIFRESIVLISCSILFILALLFKHLKININILEDFKSKNKKLIILNLIIVSLSIVIQLYLISFYSQSLPIFVTVTAILSLIAYFFISIYSLITLSKLSIANQNLDQEKENNRILKEMQDELRGFRHDFSNIMCTIGGYVQVKDIEGLTKYYSQIQKDINKVNNLGSLNSDTINNPAVFVLISSKYSKALELGIDMNINVFLDLNKLNMKIYEFTRVLGILLDNALEAAKECDEKIINIEIRKETNRNRQLLIIENTYNNKDIDTEKIFEKNFSTKSGNSGLGLWEVRQILKKNNNLNLFTSKNEKLFKQQLEMYN